MTGNRIWVLATAVASIAILALGWFIGVSPKLTEISTIDGQKVNVDALNAQYTAQLAQLAADVDNLPAIIEELEALREQLPPDSDYSAFLDELDGIAGGAGVTVTSVSFSAPTLLQAAGGGEASAPEATESTEEAPAAPVAPEATSNVPPAGSLVAIPTSITLSGSFPDLRAASGAMQEGNRLFLVSGLAFAGGEEDQYTLTVTGLIYVLTDGSTVDTSAPDAEPAPEATETPAP